MQGLMRVQIFFVRPLRRDSFAFGHDDGLARGHIRQPVHLPARPQNLDAVRFLALAESESED